jgi:hypothetical protein
VVDGQIIQGRRIGPEEMGTIRALLQAHPQWSRWRLSRELARQWHWYSSSGQLKDMAARTLLLKLQQRQLIILPERRRRPVRRVPDRSSDLFDALIPDPIEQPLRALRPLQILCVRPGHHDYYVFERHLVRHHYLSYGGPVGENVGYLVRDRQGRDLACLLFGAAAWKCAPRDQWIGWSAAQRTQRLHLVANNSRFLILPWARVRLLASHLLGQIARRIHSDWQAKYGHRIELLESFVQRDRFRGSCYRAANWICVGQTSGRTRQDRHHRLQTPRKAIFLYPLHSKTRCRLCHEPA